MKGKKKTILALLAALCMSTAVAGFAACGEDGPHTHVDADNNGVCDECNEPLRYVVSFDTNGGNALPKQGVEIGGKAAKPADPVRDGYLFDGWYKEDGAAFDFDAEITGNVTVYAHWKDASATAETYFAFKDVDGGVEISVKLGETLPQDVILPAEHEGKKVVAIAEEGFAYQPALRGVRIPASVKKIGVRAFRGCNALTTVNGGENVEEIGYGAFNSTAWDAGLTVGEVYLGKTFYKYAGSLYADTQITAKEGTVGIAAGAFQGLTHLVGVTLPETVKNIGPYAFAGAGLVSVTVNAATPATLGANALAEFKGSVFVPKAAVESYKAAEGWEAYAESIFAIGTAEQTFVVTFSAEGAEDVPAAQNVKGFEKATAPAKNPSKTGYDFGGWYKDAECTVPFDFDGPITGNTTVYAKFGKFYNVTFSTGEGASTEASQHVEAGKTAKKPAKDPTKEGADFMGWYRDEACTKEFDFDAPITAETTVYAKFLAKGADYTGEGDYEGWVIENGALKSYTGSQTTIKIPKELTRLDSVTQLVYDSRGGPNQISLLKKITSIAVEEGSTAFKVENNTLMSYDGSVIYYCYSTARVSALNYPDAVKIAPYAFAGISAFGGANYMGLFSFSDNLIEVGEYAFYQFAALNGAYDSLFGSVEKVGKYAFFDTAFETIYCNAKYVGESAFQVSGNIAQQYTRIKEIRLPNIVTIGDHAFSIDISSANSHNAGCKKIVIGPNCKTIGAGAFKWNVQQCDLDIVILGDTLPVLANQSLGNSIGNNNQYGTKRFVYVKESLLQKAKHENAYLGNPLGFFTEDGWGLREDGSFAFYEGDMTSVILPAAVKSLDSILDIFSTAANLDKCTSFAVAQDSENFKMQDGALVSADGKTLYGYFGSGAGNFTAVTEIKPYAFYNRLKAGANITFGTPETVGEYAFYGCAGLTSFAPFENLATVAAHAFEKSGLTAATLTNPALTEIGEGAFAGCENLKLYVKLLTPPTLPAKAVAATCELYVPQEIVETYKSAWASYVSQIKEDSNTHVYTVTFDTDTENGGTAVESQQYLSGGKVVKPETDPTREGYYFDGWYTKDGSVGGDWGTAYNFESSNVTASVTIYAKWTKGVTVTYDTGDSGAEVQSEMVYPGKPATQPENPKWSGHVFQGWYKDEQCSEGQEFDFTKDKIDSDITLYAKWESGKTVTFSTGDGGSHVEEQAVLPGEKVTRPAEDPTRKGYKFVDWYTKDGTDGDWGDLFNFDTYEMGSSDLTIYAKWEEDFWEIDESGKLTHYYGPTETVELPATVKSITSVLDIFGTKANLAACTSFTVAGESTSFKMDHGALLSYDGTTLYAFFGDEGTELTWNSVTAIGDYAFYGHLKDDKTLAFSAELKSVGVSAFESTGITKFTPFENVETIGKDAFKSTKLVDIVWNGTTISAAFSNITTLKTVKLMKAVTIAASAFTGCSGITTLWIGPNIKTIGQSSFTTAGLKKALRTIYIYATTPPTLGSTSSCNDNTHPFGGGSTGNKTVCTLYVPNSALSQYKQSTRVNWNWYAASRYKAITVDITYHMGEGEGAPAAPTTSVYWGGTFTEPATPKWKGKIFAGWYTDADCSEGNEYTAFGTVIKEESLELWAKWEDNGLWVEFNTGDGGSTVDWQALRSGDKATQPETPTKAGYEFLGWYTKDGTESGDWGDQFNFETEIRENTTLYAKWEQGALVTFDMNGGTKPSGFVTPLTVKKGATVSAPAKNPTRSGWTFEGWWTKDGDEDGDWGEQFIFDEDTVEGDITLYARWNPWVLDADGYLKSYAGAKTGTINIPANIKIKDITALFGTSVSSFPTEAVTITVAAENTYLKVVGDALVSYDGKTLYYYFGTGASYSSEDIETLAPYAFAVNSKLESKDALTSVTLTKVTAIPAYCFYYRGGLETLSFGTLTEIGSNSFSNAKIASFDLFANLTAIPDYAFSGANFTTKEITVNAATVGMMAFYKAGFTKLTLGENVTNIASNGFNGLAHGAIVILNCTSVPTIDANFPFGHGEAGTFDGVFVVPKGKIDAYKESGNWKAKFASSKYVEADNYELLDGGWVIEKSGKLLAYSGDKATIVIPEKVKSMDGILDLFGSSANIATCKSLTVAAENTSFKVENEMLVDYATGKIVYLYLGTSAAPDLSTVTEIKPYAFYNKTAITSVSLDAVTKIGSYAFYGCSALKTITIGAGVTEIGGYAFGSIPTGTTVTINATTPPTLGTYVFGTTTSKVTVKVPSASVDAYKAESSWSIYKSRITAQS